MVLTHAVNPAAAAELISGFLARTVTYQGHLVGGIEILRLHKQLAVNDRDDFLKNALAEFSQGAPVPSKIADVRVWQVDGARGTKVGAVSWFHANDMVILWSSGVADARRLATAYISAS